jgi:protein SCO1/2
LAVSERAEEGVEGVSTLPVLLPSYAGPLPQRERRGSIRRALAVGAVSAALAVAPFVFAHNPGKDARLPQIGPAPDFTLTNQDGKRFALRDVRGQVAVVTFIFTTCSDTCPMLTAKLALIQRKLGPDEPKVQFAAITVDPLNDTPAVLKQYAQAHSIASPRFTFLTGSQTEIDEVARRYAIYRKQQPGGSVEHTFLTSIIDGGGTLRVQYLGARFDPKEFLADLKSVLAEGAQ